MSQARNTAKGSRLRRTASALASGLGVILAANTLCAGAVDIYTSEDARKACQKRAAEEQKVRQAERQAQELRLRAQKARAKASKAEDSARQRLKPAPTGSQQADPPTSAIRNVTPGRSTDGSPTVTMPAENPLKEPLTNAAQMKEPSTASAAPATPDRLSQPPAAQSPREATVGKPSGKTRQRGLAPCLAWIDPDLEPKAALLCVHGLGLDNASYEPFGRRMAALGIAVYALDVRGFGSWQKAKGRESVDFDDCLNDVFDTLKVIRRVHPRLPVFILGESMGGAIALRVTADNPQLVDGLISSVPAGNRFGQSRQALKVAWRFLQGPNKKFDVGTGVIEQASGTNAELKKKWCEDPLARLDLSPRELIQFQRFMNDNHKSARNITQRPVLMVQGEEDKLVNPQSTIQLYEELATSDKQLQLIRGAQHLIFEAGQFNDQEIKLVNDWINNHLKAPENAVSQAPGARRSKP